MAFDAALSNILDFSLVLVLPLDEARLHVIRSMLKRSIGLFSTGGI
jgi:hypothetical protein